MKIGKKGILRKVIVQSSGNNNKVAIKDGFYSKHGLIININGNNNSVIIGENASFYDGLSRISIVGDNCSIELGNHFCCKQSFFSCRDNGSKIIIGDDADIASNVSIISMEGKGIFIGYHFFCSYNVEIRNTDSHSIVDEANNRLNFAKDVHIKDGVWIAQGSLILKGSVVNKGTIVAAKSLVNRPFEKEHCLIAGSPASIKKEQVYWKKERV